MRCSLRLASRLRTLWTVLVVLLLPPAILYWPFLFGGRYLFWGTPLLQFWPWRQLAVEELRAGRLPLWNPHAGCGVPLLADHQTAVFYPPNLIFMLMPVERAMGVSLALHALLAGLSMYALARELGRSRLAGLVAGLAFMLSAYLVARGSFLTEVSAIVWLPLLWLFARRLTRLGRPWQQRVRALVPMALVIALQFLAGHAQTWFYSLVSLALYGLWRVGAGLPFLNPRRKAQGGEAKAPLPGVSDATHRQARAAVGGGRLERGTVAALKSSIVRFLLLGAAVLWGVALAAVQFLPTLELSRLAQRSRSGNWETFALQYSMWPWRLITLLLPDFFGNPARGSYWGYATYWEDAGYIGVLPFALAALAVLAWVRHRWSRAPRMSQAPEPVPFFSLLALFSLLMALGRNTPFYLFFFRHLPGFAQFQAPARWLGIYTAAMAVLAGAGLDALRPSRALRFAARLGLVAGLQTAILAWMATTEGAQAWLGEAGLPDVQPTFAHALLRFSLLATTSLLLLLWGQRRFQSPHIDTLQHKGQLRALAWPAAVLLLVAGDLIYAGYGLNPAIDPALYAGRTETGAALAASDLQGRLYYSAEDREQVLFGRYLDFRDYHSDLRSAARLDYWWGLRESLVPDLPMAEGLPSANTFEPLVEARYRTLLQALQETDPQITQRTLGLMNVAYLFEPDDMRHGGVVHRAISATVYRNPDLRPRAYVAYRAQVADSPQQALDLLLSPTFDPTSVILENPNLQSLVFRPPTLQPADPPVLLPNPPNQVTISATLAQPGHLVLMDTFYPGWRATVDGQAAEIERANYAFRAIALEAGAHEVVLSYRPRPLIAGTIVSCAAMTATALALVLLGWEKEKH